MSARPRAVAVVQGGRSSEAEVSRASARAIAAALAAAGHRAVRLELDAFLADSLRTGGFEVVFPIAHGAVGEDGALQGLLEVLEIPYVGSDVLASALAMNKRAAKVMFADARLPLARGTALSKRAFADARAAADHALGELGDRLVVKPCSSGSAIGVTRFPSGATADAVARALDDAWRLDEVVLVERFAEGREVTCGVLDVAERGPIALPPTEIRSPEDAFYTYEARYAPGRSEHLCPAPIERAVLERIQQVAVGAHRALGCRDLSRVDFVAGETPGDVVLLEVNTLPGFTETSLFPEAAAVAGIPMAELCSSLVDSALRRGPPRRNAAIPLPR